MEKRKKVYFYGLDYLRVGLVIDATFFHTLFFGTRPGFLFLNPGEGYVDGPWFLQMLTLNLFYLAIPTFFTVSLLLYAANSHGEWSYFRKRIGRLLLLFLFWLGVQVIYRLIFTPEWFGQNLNSVWGVIQGIMGGAGSLYWFFFSLLAVTVILQCYLALLKRIERGKVLWMWTAFLCSLVLMLSTPYWIKEDFFGNPIPFIPYVFVTPLILHYHAKLKEAAPWKLWVTIFSLMGLWLFFSWLDWQLQPHYEQLGYLVFVLPYYIRLSLVFGCLMLIFSSFRRKAIAPKWARVIGDYSLGIYCLHLFVPFCLSVQEVLLGWGLPLVLVELLMVSYRIGGAMLMTWLLRFIPFMRRVL